ncbi:MAG: arcB [Gammaproteobacteria bacterium]|jgi:ornithine carbamoyltransferase|nr:arcB [Gammaproteobacteria bacterium]
MHCLSDLHNLETEFAKKAAEGFGLKSREVSNKAFNSQHAIVFLQAQNRLHTLKALIVASIGKNCN